MNYICHLPMMPMRADGNHRSEMVSMIIFGEAFSILESRPDHWHRIKCRFDGYEGWVFGRGLIEADDKYLARYDAERPYHLVKGYYQEGTELSLDTQRIFKQLIIPHGGRLPLFDGENIYLGQHKIALPSIEHKAAKPAPKPIGHSIVNAAKQYIGSPYLWGGRNQGGIDCSGLVQMVYKTNGVSLPRDAYQQAEVGSDVSSLKEAQEGDLVFFAEKERISHVGILLSGEEIIHASESVRVDQISEEGIWNEALQQHTLKIKSIKRVI